jgi:hypothetical protein
MGTPSRKPGEESMITWRHDFETLLEEAKALDRPILLDFSAAPM